jgi:opacity protein-like surface antigen
MRGIRRVLGALCVSLLVAALPLQAQERSGLELSLGAGAGVPSGNLNDVNDLGWHGQFAASYTFVNVPVGLQLDGNYSRFAAGTTLDLKDELIYGTLNGVYKFRLNGTVVEPYAIAGGGVYHVDAAGTDAAGIHSRTRAGLNAGLGLTFRLSELKLFFESRYHNVFSGLPGDLDAKFVNLTMGLRLGR